MKIVQTPYFKRRYKKLHPNEVGPVNKAIRQVISDPSCSEEKRGDRAGVRVYKFRVNERQYLLAYLNDRDTLFLLALGVHENFYRNLKR